MLEGHVQTIQDPVFAKKSKLPILLPFLGIMASVLLTILLTKCGHTGIKQAMRVCMENFYDQATGLEVILYWGFIIAAIVSLGFLVKNLARFQQEIIAEGGTTVVKIKYSKKHIVFSTLLGAIVAVVIFYFIFKALYLI